MYWEQVVDCSSPLLDSLSPPQVDVCWKTNDGEVHRVPRKMGGIPIMTRTKACWLTGMTKAELVRAGLGGSVGGRAVAGGGDSWWGCYRW